MVLLYSSADPEMIVLSDSESGTLYNPVVLSSDSDSRVDESGLGLESR